MTEEQVNALHGVVIFLTSICDRISDTDNAAFNGG